ncbi:MinD/ParA family ATP-binding protein [Halorussus ruber]|uniref:MinD/ParA family ATP-binding protein n=1 Tax=Halorussus ruber TaxID=1126238 RepID=UPI001092A182
MLAVAGGKGGAGKTTTTLGLAGALARQRRTVLAADADREMPDLHAMAGVARSPGLDAVAAGWPARFVAERGGTSSGEVSILPAASGPANADRRQKLTTPEIASLNPAEEWADAVLLDCPAGAGPDAVAPLRAADAVVVVTTAEPACLRDSSKTAAMARELGTPVAGAVVSRAEDPPEGVSRLLECPLLGTVPDAGVESPTSAAPSGDEPLADERVRAAHDRLVSALQPKYL